MTRGHRGSLLLRCRTPSFLTPSRFIRALCEHVFAMAWSPPDPYSYAHRLGWYLGGGYVSAIRTTFQLVIVCDAAYTELVDSCWASVQLTAPDRRVHVRHHPVHRYVRIESNWKRWPEVFPQHGPGRKSTRMSGRSFAGCCTRM